MNLDARTPELKRAVIIGSSLAVLALLFGSRHDGFMVACILALHVIRTVVNVRGEHLAMNRIGGTHFALQTFNVIVNVTMGHVAGWPFAALMYVAWQAAIISGLRSRQVVTSALMHLVPTAILMLVDHVSLFATLVTCGTAGSIYLAVHARGMLLEDALHQLAVEHERLGKAHEELAKVHVQLVQRDRLTSLGILAAGVAHELNNPMTYVTNNVALLLEDLPRYSFLSDDVRRDYVEDVLPATFDGIQRVNAIVSDLRRFARGDIEEAVDYDVADEIRSAVRICNHHYQSGPTLDVNVFATPLLSGRPRQICQVFVNLLVNAAQATAKNGVVCVSMVDRKDAIVIEVADTGAGMGQDTQEHLFEPFFTTRKTGEGTGLGLSVVHGIVKSHGGTIEVLSVRTQGTTIRVTLPRGVEAQKSTTTSSKWPRNASDGPSM